MTKRMLHCLVLVVVLLAGCESMRKPTYTFQPPNSTQGKACIMQCEESRQMCGRVCSVEYTECKHHESDEARFRYQQYAAKQRAEGYSDFHRDIEDFYNTSQCKPTSCHCDDDYRACYQMCGGTVIMS